MINNAFGLIYAGDNNPQMKDLTFSRSVAAVPFGSRYRTIDFILSSLVNSGVKSVGVIASKNYHSLMDHLGSGKEWDLHRKREGLFVLPPFMTKDSTGVFLGTVGAIRACLGYVRRAPMDYCILCGTRTVFNADFTAMMEQHLATKADITILCADGAPARCEEQSRDLRLTLDAENRVTGMELDSYKPASMLRSCDAMIMKKELLIYLVEEAYAAGDYDFKRDVLLKKFPTLRVFGYRFNGFSARYNNVEQYFKANMALLKPEARKDLFNPEQPVYTQVKDEPPTAYGDESKCKNSLLADGCVIEGTVENSILFRGVRVKKGAVVRNCILMQGAVVGENARMDYIIMDKGVTIMPSRTLTGYENFPIIIRKGMTI